MGQDLVPLDSPAGLVDGRALSDGSDDAGAASTALAVQNVHRERTLEQFSPRHGAERSKRFWGCLASDVFVAANLRHSPVGRNAHDVASMFGIGARHSVLSSDRVSRNGYVDKLLDRAKWQRHQCSDYRKYRKCDLLSHL